MDLDQAIEVLDADDNKRWLYKFATEEVEYAIAVVLATARVVQRERERERAQRREMKQS